MFLHGWNSNKDAFAPADGLKGFTVTRVDLYGFGETPSPSYPVDLDYYVEGVKRLMARYNMENVVVIGHSFGGRVAIKLASSSRVSGVVLVDSAGLRPRRHLSYYFKVWGYKLRKRLGLETHGGSLDYRACKGAMKGTFVNVVNENLKRAAQKIPCPVLLIYGENDSETPLYMYKKFLKLIPESKGVIIEGAGHFSFLDSPERFYTLIKQFAMSV